MRAELVTFESEHFRQFNSVGVCTYTHIRRYLLTIFFIKMLTTDDLKTPSPGDKQKMGENSATQLSVTLSALLVVAVALFCPPHGMNE